MMLIVGGISSGKRAYACEIGYEREDMADAVLDDRPVLCNLQDMVARDPSGAEKWLEALCQKDVVICNEVGSGIIPLERRDREIREATGRLCVLLAKRADRVVRMVAGIPTIIKG